MFGHEQDEYYSQAGKSRVFGNWISFCLPTDTYYQVREVQYMVGGRYFYLPRHFIGVYLAAYLDVRQCTYPGTTC